MEGPVPMAGLRKTRILISLGACLVFLSSCSWFNSKTKTEKTAEKSTAHAASQSPQVWTPPQLFAAAHFFSHAMDEGLQNPSILQTKYCQIPFEEISMYSMQTKARLDDWIRGNRTQLPAVDECAKGCYCDIYDMVASLPDTEDTPTLRAQFAQSQELKKKENPQVCMKELGDFCKSSLFQALRNDVKANSP